MKAIHQGWNCERIGFGIGSSCWKNDKDDAGGKIVRINIWYLDEKYLNDLYDQMIGTSIFSLKRREEEVKESEYSAGGMLSKIVFPIGIELRKR